MRGLNESEPIYCFQEYHNNFRGSKLKDTDEDSNYKVKILLCLF